MDDRQQVDFFQAAGIHIEESLPSLKHFILSIVALIAFMVLWSSYTITQYKKVKNEREILDARQDQIIQALKGPDAPKGSRVVGVVPANVKLKETHFYPVALLLAKEIKSDMWIDKFSINLINNKFFCEGGAVTPNVVNRWSTDLEGKKTLIKGFDEITIGDRVEEKMFGRDVVYYKFNAEANLDANIRSPKK